MECNSNLTRFLQSDLDGVFYVGHASILIRLSGKTILCDPAGMSDPYFNAWYYYPDQKISKELLSVDYVFISHIHKDHLDEIYLQNISSHTKVIILDKRETLQNELKSLKVKFQIIGSDNSYNLYDDVYIDGFVNSVNKIDSSALFYNESFSVYHGNDHWADIIEVHQSLKERDLDVACVPFAFVYWYPFEFTNLTREERDAEATRLIDQHLDYAADFVKKIEPRLMIPFGSNLVHFTGAYSECNLAVKTPIEFLHYALDKIPQLSHVVEPLHADDYITCQNKKLYVTKEKRSIKEYRDSMNGYIQHCMYKNDPEHYFKKFEMVDKISFLKVIKSRANKIPALDQVLIVESQCKNRILSIDFRHGDIKFITNKDKNLIDTNYHIFTLDPYMSKAYFSGKVNFDAVLGTRRFKVYRDPDIHCKETFAFIATQI